MSADTVPVPPGTARELAEAIRELAHGFLLTLDPGAPADVSTVRLELAGPHLSVIYAQTGAAPPTLQVSLSGITNATPLAEHDPVAQERARGAFRRG